MIYDGVISKPPMEEFLQHYNHNHDPKTGQFTNNNGSSRVQISEKNQTLDSITKDKSIDFSDISYNGEASKNIKSSDIKTINNLKNQKDNIKSIIRNTKDLYELHDKLDKLSNSIERSKDLDFQYSGYGSSGAQFDGYNNDTDVSFTIFIDKNGKMILDIDHW